VARTLWDEDWATQAQCSGKDPDALFVRGKAQHDAKAVCKTCPVLAQCLAEALDNRTEFGVWGGMTERERRALLRRRPAASWRKVLEDARDEQVIPAV
jgi:WhiB family redox-sensing transcriptional regulator